ncbi:50S ribosomal protein L24 [Clostridium acetireducens DSM 10703]|jgi:large subunit ribosomal protein L24|uniref:Large ribosomal subunit protein uL24 n=1 Tax=Clostridium acetireducens DSM 10703 TaxID=1121290 RepID=A0A1E8F156_9CLOT|nr:50S ribosomal protein L24 [Clostridium acetireducens]OFI06882.1 50S ribosomal protein L24 [Clostridium acetireducens DSM 10703]
MASNKIHVRKQDTVMVISGKDKGKIGEVLAVYPRKGKVLVKGINIVTKHQKPNRQNMQGGIVRQEAPIFSSKVMLYCTKCKTVTRISKKVLDDGTKVRVCKKCGETF